ncbi:hypothetical protein M9H77_09811 [Catharanthus roseus]|uniref:Uncharacterized protein n=1 Tax=Catharanthus roseus TaxID=4058 RepID=A0ACC0C1U6_CATRO|nr:hypothetical protein M9H77_09811 [Catharanthus roseus]
MHGRNTVEEVLCPSAQRGYIVFHRNCEESNVLSDIVVAHPTSIAMIRTWSYVLIMDTTYKMNKDMDSEMRDLTSLIHEISKGPISNVREVRCLIKGIISPMLPEDPCQPLTIPQETAVTKGQWKTNSTKRDKSHWEYVSIAYRKIGKSSGSCSGSGSGLGLGSGPSPRGRGRLPRSSRGRGRGRNSGSTTILPLVSNMDGNARTIFIGFIEEHEHFI